MASRFQHAIDEFGKTSHNRVHPILIQAERNGIESQLETILEEIKEYEQLKTKEISIIEINSFDELADGLIKARIASKLSQKQLADRLGIKEQQIQRYEAERYSSASYQRLRDIAKALGIQIRNDILMPITPSNFEELTTKLGQVGISREFLVSRLLPSSDASRISGETPGEDEEAISAKVGSILNRVFGWTMDNIFGPQPLGVPRFAAAEARFKMPAGRTQRTTSLYAAYANYIAVVVLRGSNKLETMNIPTEPLELHDEICRHYGELTLSTALHYAWDHGIPVLPLRDRGTFHGACWRYEGRNIIVLKQQSRHEARWLFDLLHELYHSAQKPDANTLEVIEAEETSTERRHSAEEISASQFAGNVVLNGKAEDLAQACVQAANGSVERLKSVVPDIASREGVGVGVLANYMAFRLSWQNINWWGAASNLQVDDTNPWDIARTVFMERFPFVFDNEIDKQLLERALQQGEDDDR